METVELKEEIKKLKAAKNAVILAHYYQDKSIQELADYVGDSLDLSRRASQTDADIIVFAGVHFMAETAKILNPIRKVLLPDLNAGCSLADGCPPDQFRAFKAQYPGHLVVTYINCSAAIKSMSDYVCTSSNALSIIQSIPKTQPIIFAPDKNLGRYLIKNSGREMVLWDGSCVVHEAFSVEKLYNLKKKHPEAAIVAHPESEEQLLKFADFVGSTSQMIKYVQESDANTFLVATEAGILHQMQKGVPSKTLIPVPIAEDNSCACSECAFMKMNSLEKLYNCLLNESPEINIEEDLRQSAFKPIERMLTFA
ncbi:MAG: quinolinate synthase NadA [Vicingaceae bacterium]